jgi:hypothetical protein
VTKVLNPYSINNCFSDNILDNYWWKTGSPLLLDHAISKNPTYYLQPNLENLRAEEVDQKEIGDLSPVSLLFQTGYLTISKITPESNETINDDGAKSADISYYYTLKVPKNEILYFYNKGLFKHLFPLLTDSKLKKSCYTDIICAITTENSIKLADILHAQLARIPYPPHGERTKKWKLDPELGEFHLHAVFLNFFDGLSLKITPKAISSQDRSDIDITLPNDVHVVLELKYISTKSEKAQSSGKLSKDVDNAADKAIKQLKNTLQDKKYRHQTSKIIMAGIVIYDRDKVFVKFADVASLEDAGAGDCTNGKL